MELLDKKVRKITNPKQRQHWWLALEPQWKKAFNETILRKGPIEDLPSDSDLIQLFSHKFLRFAGPQAPFPNMSFELTNLSGLTAFTDAELISVTYHLLTSLGEIAHLTKLKNLFADNNRLAEIDGVKNMLALEELFINNNRITTLKPVAKLTNLKSLYCAANALTSFDGLTEKHSDKLLHFICLPNEGVHQKELIRVEHTLGIRCKGFQ